jgi:uncharacterized lipoprotein YmbA
MKQPFLSAMLGVSVSVLGLALLGGCNVIPPVQPDTTRYYVLSGPSVIVAPAVPGTGTLRIGVRPVEIAPYLRRGSIVVRTGENEVSFANDARWAEPLEQEIGNSLRQRLLATPAVARVFTPPFPFESNRDFDVSVQILRCEGVREKNGKAAARLAAAIEISTAGENPQIVTRRHFESADEAWDGKDFARLAASLSELVNALSQGVVEALPEKK